MVMINFELNLRLVVRNLTRHKELREIQSHWFILFNFFFRTFTPLQRRKVIASEAERSEASS